MTMAIRASMLDAYQDCGLRAAVHQWPAMFTSRGFTLRQLQPSIAAVVGIGSHAAVAHTLGEKLRSGALGAVDEAVDHARVVITREIQDGVLTDDITRSPGEALDQVSRITRAFTGLVGYRVQPRFVEQRWRASLAAIKPGWELTGRIDAGYENGDLPDLKTGRANRLYINQIGAYDLLAEANGFTPKRSGTLGIRRTKSGDAQPGPVENWYDDRRASRMAAWQMARRIIREVDQFDLTSNPMVFTPNPSSWFCKETTCSAHSTNTCPLWRLKSQGGKS